MTGVVSGQLRCKVSVLLPHLSPLEMPGGLWAPALPFLIINMAPNLNTGHWWPCWYRLPKAEVRHRCWCWSLLIHGEFPRRWRVCWWRLTRGSPFLSSGDKFLRPHGSTEPWIDISCPLLPTPVIKFDLFIRHNRRWIIASFDKK